MFVCACICYSKLKKISYERALAWKTGKGMLERALLHLPTQCALKQKYLEQT